MANVKEARLHEPIFFKGDSRGHRPGVRCGCRIRPPRAASAFVHPRTMKRSALLAKYPHYTHNHSVLSVNA